MNESDIVGKVIQNYKILKPLGQGKFSVVYKAERLTDNKQVALKIVKIFDMMDVKQREKCLQEVKLLQSFDHPNIIRYLDSFILQNELYIAIEWADRGDLKRFIKKCTTESEKVELEKIITSIKELGSALMHMHERRIIHRDLKPANILIFGDGTLKLGDLGLGRYMSNETCKAFSKVGTPLYMAPEVIRDGGYDFKSDIWSLGCVIYELITFKSPFRADDRISLLELFNKINKGEYNKITDEKYPSEIRVLVDRMLVVNPEERVSLEEIMKVCDNCLHQIEENKPKVDPFIIMEDIVEKLRLINFENIFIKKFNMPQISRIYFAYPIKGNVFSNNCLNFEENILQFEYFYQICSWLLFLIKEKIDIKLLNKSEFEYKYILKDFNRERQTEIYLKELLDQIKPIVKIQDYVKNKNLVNGWGEGPCMIINELLNKYLIDQNFIFLPPKLEFDEETNIENFQEIILEEDLNEANNDMNNKNSIIKGIPNGDIDEVDYMKDHDKKKEKNIPSAVSHNTDLNSALSTYTENFKFDPNHCIIEPSVDPHEWKKECEKVEKLLVIKEDVEFIYNSQSDQNLKSVINFEEDLFKDWYYRTKILSTITSYYDSTIKNNDQTQTLNLSTNIEKNLRLISDREERITRNIVKKYGKISNTSHLKKQKEDDLRKTNEIISFYENKLNTLEDKIDDRKIKFENLKNVDHKQKIKDVHRVIQNLKKENQQLDLKNGILDQNLLKYIKEADKYPINLETENTFDEVL